MVLRVPEFDSEGIARGDRDLRVRKSGSQPTHGNVVVYLPRGGLGGFDADSVNKFEGVFQDVGLVIVPRLTL